MQTTIHYYSFNIENDTERKAYAELRAELKHTPGRGHWMHCHGTSGDHKHKHGDSEEITLETKCLFENQWNTAEPHNQRVFDWYEGVFPNTRIKAGHYLEITDDMREIRRNTHKCGYCGNFEPAPKGYVFCPKCLGSEYLKESELHLTRMRPVDTPFRENRAPLTEAEAAHLAPLYVEAQIHGTTTRDKARIKKQRADLEQELKDSIHQANMKYHGFLWLMNHGIKTGNCIYYSHTDRFCFGWRKVLAGAELSALQDALCEFPYDYDLTTTVNDCYRYGGAEKAA
jgi:hypothetical protein